LERGDAVSDRVYKVRFDRIAIWSRIQNNRLSLNWRSHRFERMRLA
jgi:hypothetical protein